MEQQLPPNRDLAHEVSRVADELKRMNSPLRPFLRGLVQGLGTALGATVIAIAFLYAFGAILHAIGLDKLIDSLGALQQYLPKK